MFEQHCQIVGVKFPFLNHREIYNITQLHKLHGNLFLRKRPRVFRCTLSVLITTPDAVS